MKLFLFVLLSALVARAEQQKIPQGNLIDYSLYSTMMAMHLLDYTSTEYVLHKPNTKELVLPTALVRNKAAFLSYELAGGAASIFASQLLVHRGHRKLARALTSVQIGYAGFVVQHNYSLR